MEYLLRLIMLKSNYAIKFFSTFDLWEIWIGIDNRDILQYSPQDINKDNSQLDEYSSDGWFKKVSIFQESVWFCNI